MDGQPGSNQNLVEVTARRSAAPHAAFDLHFKIGIVKIRTPGDIVECRREAASKRTKQQLLRCPAALQASQLRSLGEMDRVRRRLALGKSGAAGSPPGRNAICIFRRHCYYTPGIGEAFSLRTTERRSP